MQNQINLTPFTQFIQQVRSLALAECMDKLNNDYESMFNELKRSQDTEVISLSMDGGGFEDKK